MRFGFNAVNAASVRDASRRATHPLVERLDPRQLLTVAVPAPDVTMIAASTTDSQSVTITYDVQTATSLPVQLGFYRSADAKFSSDDVPVESIVQLPTVDSAGNNLSAVGIHKVTVPIPGGLPLNPAHPYVLAVANPTEASAADPTATASFRTYTIGVVTHGGLQLKSYTKTGVPWANETARELHAEGYDAVIPYNWVAASTHPGSAAKQGPKLAAQVLALSKQFPATSPVDIHFIGHSEGASLNTVAIADVAANPTPQLAAGYWQDTLLDPHAANPDFTGKQYDTHGLLAPVAKFFIDNYQARARDPISYIPNRVNASEVFFQQTPAYHDHGANAGIYNLWGQVPVKGDSVYYNLTPSGIVHSGKNSVYSWYQNFVVPTLGDGGTGIKAAALTGAPVATTAHPALASGSTVPVSASGQVYTGTAEAGSPVLIRASHPRRKDFQTIARTTADASGHWTATSTENLPAGRYRVVAVSKVTGTFAGKRPVMGVTPLGGLVVDPSYRG